MMNELTYHRKGDYLLPDLLPPEAPRIGIWGMRRSQKSSSLKTYTTYGQGKKTRECVAGDVN